MKIDDAIGQDKKLWADTIVSGTGLDRAIADEAIKNLYPDYDMHRELAVAIAKMMFELKYISKDVSPAVEKNMDYQFLEVATGKPKSEAGLLRKCEAGPRGSSSR